MIKTPLFNLLKLFIVISFIITLGCNSGVEVSSGPGILRVTLQADPADTSIVIVTDTFAVSEGDIFDVIIFQGKVFRNGAFAVLYDTLTSTSQLEINHNFIQMMDGKYQRFTIFESNIPPADYTGIQFGVAAQFLFMAGTTGIIYVPVETPQGYFIDLDANIDVKANKTTELVVQVSPFKYTRRYRDVFLFTPEMEVIDVIYH